MSKIRSVEALEILDSRGTPTLQVTIKTDDNHSGTAAIPSGASTGQHEALELRDKDPLRFLGKGVQKAVEHVNTNIAKLIVGHSIFDQMQLDHLMISTDGTDNKSHLGANAILGCSLAIAHTAANCSRMPLYRYIGGPFAHILPCPMINIINGGAHADNSLDFQEFMIRPIGASTFSEAIRWSAEIFHHLKKILQEAKLATSVGDEGGFAPNLHSNEEAIEMILRAIEKAGYRPQEQISIALDCAASEFYGEKTKRYCEKKKQLQGLKYAERNTSEQIDYLIYLCKKYPIDSIEDGLDQNDWDGWHQLNQAIGNKVQIVGDDIFVTNTKFLQKGIKTNAANSILIKLNQIGTLTETMNCISMAKSHGFTTILSHRSGETEDTTIADISVAVNSGQIKTGSLSRTDRVAKYNRLLAIEKQLNTSAIYRDSNRCRHLGRIEKCN